jgi:hydrogenase maturation protease
VTPRILVAGIGNIFFRDDGFGPAVVAAMLAADVPLADGVHVVDYGIRGMHLTYDLLNGYDALVLIDALPGETPGAITVLEVGPDDLGEGEFDAHGMQPVSLLASFSTMGGELPPTYVVGCAAADVSEGIGLSDPVSGAVDAAVTAVTTLIDELCLTSAGRVTD